MFFFKMMRNTILRCFVWRALRAKKSWYENHFNAILFFVIIIHIFKILYIFTFLRYYTLTRNVINVMTSTIYVHLTKSFVPHSFNRKEHLDCVVVSLL